MSQEEQKTISLNQWAGHLITIFVLGCTIAATQGSSAAQVTGLKAEMAEVKSRYEVVLEDLTKEIRSLNNRISRIEGKLEK